MTWCPKKGTMLLVVSRLLSTPVFIQSLHWYWRNWKFIFKLVFILKIENGTANSKSKWEWNEKNWKCWFYLALTLRIEQIILSFFSSCLSHVWVKSPLVLDPPMDPISNVPNANPEVDFLCWESVFFYCTSDHLIFFFAFYFHQSSLLTLAKRLGLVPVNRLGWKPPKIRIILGFLTSDLSYL